MPFCTSTISHIPQEWVCHFSTVPFLLNYDVMTWKQFPYYWPFERGIHPSLVKPVTGGFRLQKTERVLMFSLLLPGASIWSNIRNYMTLMWHHRKENTPNSPSSPTVVGYGRSFLFDKPGLNYSSRLLCSVKYHFILGPVLRVRNENHKTYPMWKQLLCKALLSLAERIVNESHQATGYCYKINKTKDSNGTD